MNSLIVQKIRQLQVNEGSKPCFRTGKLVCPYEDSCCWAEICDFETVKIRPSIKYEVTE